MLDEKSKKIVFNDEKSKIWLITLLKERPATIIFEKSDGTERKLLCSLQENVIPKIDIEKSKKKVVNLEVLPVFDLENNGWRSFRWDSVKSIHFSLQ
jgi:hypothetical protein